MRNQSLGGSKLPDLSETVEQEKGDGPCLPSCSCKTKKYFQRCRTGRVLPEPQGKSD